MRRLELLIKQARSESQNKEYSTTVGIPQEDFVAWANEAQDRLYSEAIKQHPKYFTSEDSITVVSGQEAYNLPSTTFLSHIENVEYSSDGTNFYDLDEATIKERSSVPSGNPSQYIRRGKQILLVPAPLGSGASLRITHVKKVPRLDIRRSAITSVTVASSNITAMTLTAASLLALDPGLVRDDMNYLSIVDRDGALVVSSLEYDSINAGTGVVTITGGTSAITSSDSTPTTSDFITLGAYTSNLPDLPDTAERYLIEFMTFRATFRDGSQRSKAQKDLCDEILNDTLQSFADIDHDVMSIPILNTDYFDV